jgi:hypothetical protein
MKIIFKIIPAGALLLAALWPSAARADRRAYAATYEAVTAPKGELDVETWSTYATDGEVPDGPAGAKGFRNMLELEYGLTERWDVALYNMVDTFTETSQTGYAGAKVETRYRLLPPASWVLDPILYFEAQFLRHGDANMKYELKLILARDEGPWNFALNIAGEGEHLRDGTWVPELEFAFGISRELAGPAFKLGAEIFGKVEREAGATSAFAWTGPALSWATRFPERTLQGLWITVGGGRGITDESQAWYGRGIVGLQF